MVVSKRGISRRPLVNLLRVNLRAKPVSALNDIFGESGFSTSFRLTQRELVDIREAIRSQWLSRIQRVAPRSADRFADLPIDQYHELSYLIDHKAAWPKSERLLPAAFVQEMRKGPFFQSLEAAFGPFLVSNEEGLRPEEIYWRLVRPNRLEDIGPMHADAWFWELGHGVAPANTTRIKVWVALHCERGRNGFRLVRGSHHTDWPYSAESRDGYVKPVIELDECKLDIELFESSPGQAIVFNDRLLHGGASGGASTRVSFEFTILVDCKLQLRA